jgi:hypothetical protein
MYEVAEYQANFIIMAAMPASGVPDGCHCIRFRDVSSFVSPLAGSFPYLTDII